MKKLLYQYDIYPKVFMADRDVDITVHPLDEKVAFVPGHVYKLSICKFSEGNPWHYPERDKSIYLSVTADSKNDLHFTVNTSEEGEYLILVYNESGDPKTICNLNVFCLAEDMKGRIPLRGDLHLHTCRSDGRESPYTVSANYRGHGYDFFVLSDHHRYYPSLEALRFYEGLTDACIVPGEEVHLPMNDPHYINFGGSYSINALITPNKNQEKAGDDPEWRSIDGICPPTMTEEEFRNMVEEKAKAVPLKNETERKSFAILQWIYENVQKGGGLAVFPHPYWRHPLDQVPDEYLNNIYENKPFDAFEVLGGESYYAHNGFQTAYYYEMKAKGFDYPVVGSTDSHSSLAEHNANALICSTVVFASENKKEAIISAIKDKYSVAVDTISREYRLVGDMRLVKYASFLLEEFYPLHDLACRNEGYYLFRYINGDKDALAVLNAMKGQVPKLIDKYIQTK